MPGFHTIVARRAALRPCFILASVLVSFVALLSPLHAQEWHLVESGVTSDLYDIQFVDKNTGWAVGADSTIIKTTDGGHTWFQQTGGVAEEYRCLFFRDANLGWIGGSGGTILHTTNGGLSWEQQITNTITHVNDIEFVSDSIGWVAGSIFPGICSHWGSQPCGAVLKTTNTGTSWELVLQTPIHDSVTNEALFDGEIKAIDFIDGNYGCVVGVSPSDRAQTEGIAYVTYDGGSNWRKLNDRADGAFLYTIAIIDTNHFIVGGVGMQRFNDEIQRSEELFTPYSYVYDLSMSDTNHIYALAIRDSGVRVLSYENGSLVGINQWLEGPHIGYPSGVGGHFMGICMIDTITGWVCGDSGRLWNMPGLVNAVDFPPQVDENAFSIDAIYPNPARSSVTVHFQLPTQSHVRLAVYSMLGERVSVLEDGPRAKGRHRIECTMPTHLPAGLYFYELQTPQGTARRSMVLAK